MEVRNHITSEPAVMVNAGHSSRIHVNVAVLGRDIGKRDRTAFVKINGPRTAHREIQHWQSVVSKVIVPPAVAMSSSAVITVAGSPSSLIAAAEVSVTPPSEPAKIAATNMSPTVVVNLISFVSLIRTRRHRRHREGPTGRDADTAIGRGDAGKLDRIGLIDFDRTAGSGGQVCTGNRHVQSDRTTGCGRQLDPPSPPPRRCRPP